MNQPDDGMLAPVRRIAEYMETLDVDVLAETFAAHDVVLIDSFPPFVFSGPSAGDRWAAGFADHVRDHVGLRHTFGEPQEFCHDGDTVFYSQPITWAFAGTNGTVSETGGLAVVLVREGKRWLVRNTGWAVTDYHRV
jgi:hypothetical protein